MVIILVLFTTACSSMKKNEEGKYEINPIGTIIRTIFTTNCSSINRSHVGAVLKGGTTTTAIVC